MIIALSGKIKSGKSTVANIIQLLIANKKLSDENPKDSFVYLLKPELLNIYEIKELNVISGWKQVAFAAKLKQIVALLIGCTVEQLESQEFKSSPLGKVWERWYYSFYKMKTNENNGRVSPYFDTKEECKNYEFSKVFGKPIYNKEQLYLESEILTPRLIMQLVGTNLFRNQLHPNIWINGLFADYKPTCNTKSPITVDTVPNWIITDLRFPNELQAIKERNGIIIRINRPDYSFDKNGKRIITDKEYVNLNQKEHESETALDDYNDFDYVIENNSTIEDLIHQVENMMIHFKIL